MEMKLNMKDTTEKTKRSLSDSLGEYVCIDAKESKIVFNYFKGLNKEAEDMVRVHLHLCLHCKEKVTQDILRKRAMNALNHIMKNNSNGDVSNTENGKENRQEKDISVKIEGSKIVV